MSVWVNRKPRNKRIPTYYTIKFQIVTNHNFCYFEYERVLKLGSGRVVYNKCVSAIVIYYIYITY